MNLAVDIGNSFIKLALFEDGRIVDTFRMHDYDARQTEAILASNPSIDRAICSSCRRGIDELERQLKAAVGQYFRFDHTVPVPIVNLYETPATLGCDRLAGAVGAHTLYPGHTVLVVDFGTAITYDLVTARGEFAGGNISPGAHIRFRALHEHTHNLPLLEPAAENPGPLMGLGTGAAIRNGVMRGILFETEGYIGALTKEYGEIKIIFTGGDANYFAERVKKPIFATSDLVFYGLNAILEHNAELN